MSKSLSTNVHTILILSKRTDKSLTVVKIAKKEGRFLQVGADRRECGTKSGERRVRNRIVIRVTTHRTQGE